MKFINAERHQTALHSSKCPVTAYDCATGMFLNQYFHLKKIEDQLCLWEFEINLSLLSKPMDAHPPKPAFIYSSSLVVLQIEGKTSQVENQILLSFAQNHCSKFLM